MSSDDEHDMAAKILDEATLRELRECEPHTEPEGFYENWDDYLFEKKAEEHLKDYAIRNSGEDISDDAVEYVFDSVADQKGYLPSPGQIDEMLEHMNWGDAGLSPYRIANRL